LLNTQDLAEQRLRSGPKMIFMQIN